jgi:xylulokinase
MPAPPKLGLAFFLGLELSTDQLRTSIGDEGLELVNVKCADWTASCNFQFVFCLTVGIAHPQHSRTTTPGNAYTTPVEMWVKGLDILNLFFAWKRNQIFRRS